jgi:hypothetical protein
LKQLVSRADFLLENFRPGTLENWGLGWQELSAVNPRLIMIRVSGFGQPAEDRVLVCRDQHEPGRLDLDDLGAEIAEQLPAERAREQRAELDHAQSLQRAGLECRTIRHGFAGSPTVVSGGRLL